MRADLPKVVFEVGGRPMICAVVDACRAAGCGRIIVVVGYKQELVREALLGTPVEFAVQLEQLGTGHAVQAAAPLLAHEIATPGHPVFVLCGDGPLVRPETLGALLDRHVGTHAAATLATAVIDDPAGYGRILRDGAGRFAGIVEEKMATAAQKRIREVNPSYYCFEAGALFTALESVGRTPVSGECYLTDVPSLLLARGRRVEVIEAVPPQDVLSINTPEELARVDAIYRSRAAGQSAAEHAARGSRA